MTGRSKGFTLLELLIVVAIVGVVLGIGFINGRETLRKQEESAALRTVQQSVWQGATSAASRGIRTKLVKSGDNLIISDTDNNKIRTFELPKDMTTNLPEGDILIFTPPGKVDETSLAQLSNLTITVNGKTYKLTISLIGEVKAEEAG